MAQNNDDISSQLKLTTQLSKTISDMAITNARIESSYSTQFDLMKNIVALQQKSEGKSTSWIDELSKSVDDAKKKSDDFSATLDKLKKSTGGVSKQSDMFGKALLSTGKKIGITTAFVSGLGQGFRNLTALGKGALGMLGTIASSIFEIGASIIAIPFKIFTRFIDMAAAAGGGSNELAEAVRKMRIEFGSLSGPTNKSIIEVSKSMSGFSATGLSTWRVFGQFSQRLEYMIDLAKEMGPTFNMFTDEFRKNGGTLLAYQKGLGLTGEQMSAFGNLSLVNGKKIADNLKDTTKYTYELGNAFKLDAKLISRDMGKALIDVKHFAGATVKQIAEASVYSRKLGIELEKITGTLDAFETFDSAAENAAKLSQSFGVTVDAFKMMQAQDPATQVDMLRKSLFAAGKSAENMTRQELKLLSQTTGLDEATAKLAFSSKNQGMSLDDIKKKGGEAAAKTLTQAEAMKKLADAIERLVMSGMTQHGGFLDQFISGVFRGMQSTHEFRKAIWNVKLGLQAVLMEGVKLGRMLVNVIPGLKDFLTGLGDIFQPSKYRKFAAGAREAFVGFFKDISDPGSKHSFSNLMTNLRKSFFDFFNSQSPAGQKMLTGFKTMFSALARASAQGIVWVSDKIGDGLKTIVDLIQHPEKLKFLGTSASAGAGFIGKTMAPLVDAVVHAFYAIEPQLEKLLGVVFTKIGDYIMGPQVMGIVKSWGLWTTVGAILFGPAVLRGVMASAAGSITTALFKGIGSAFSAGVSSLGSVAPALTKMGGMLGTTLGAAMGPAVIVALGYAVYKGMESIFDEQKAKIAELQKAGFSAANAMGANVDVDTKKKKAEELKTLIDKGTHDMTHKGFFAGILTNSDEEFAHLQDLQKEYEKLQREIITGYGKKSDAGDMKKRADNVDFLGSTSVMDAQAKLDALQKLAKKSSGKDFDVSKTLDSVREKFAGINFNIISAEQTSQIEVSTKSLGQVQDIAKVAADTLSTLSALSNVKEIKLPKDFTNNVSNVVFGLGGVLTSMSVNLVNVDTITNLKDGLTSVKGLFDNLVEVQKAASEIKSVGIKSVLESVSNMMKCVNDIDAALGSSNKINLVTKLQNVAKSVGFGSKLTTSIQNKDVVINVNLEVHMDAAELEKAMIMRANSFVRQRLDYLSDAAGAGPQISEGGQYTPSKGQPPALRRIGGVAQ